MYPSFQAVYFCLCLIMFCYMRPVTHDKLARFLMNECSSAPLFFPEENI